MRDPNAVVPPSPLAAGYKWEIGTVGAVATDGEQEYVLTAAHVVTDPYAPDAQFPAKCRVGFALRDSELQADSPAFIVSRSPLTAGRVVDVVALR